MKRADGADIVSHVYNTPNASNHEQFKYLLLWLITTTNII